LVVQSAVAAFLDAPAGHAETRIEGSIGRLYVVGQIHGAPDDIGELDERIARDAEPLAGQVMVLHAGGYIDKGNQVPELLEYLSRRNNVGVAAVTYLLGAHEWLMLRTLDGDRRAAVEWLLSGAEASLDRWQVPLQDWVSLLASSIPAQQIAFLRGLSATAFDGQTHFFCETFGTGPAQPLGLFGQLGDPGATLTKNGRTPVGNFSDIMRHSAPAPWTVSAVWTAGRVRCAVVDRRPQTTERKDAWD
jgi:hypothetical protein